MEVWEFPGHKMPLSQRKSLPTIELFLSTTHHHQTPLKTIKHQQALCTRNILHHTPSTPPNTAAKSLIFPFPFLTFLIFPFLIFAFFSARLSFLKSLNYFSFLYFSLPCPPEVSLLNFLFCDNFVAFYDILLRNKREDPVCSVDG